MLEEKIKKNVNNSVIRKKKTYSSLKKKKKESTNTKKIGYIKHKEKKRRKLLKDLFIVKNSLAYRLLRLTMRCFCVSHV